MITTHQFLPVYPIDPASEKLIVGTIHPHRHETFKVPFFYGNKGSIWMLLHEAFPSELPNPFSLHDILAFLNKRKISMSDMVLACKRRAPTALDSDLIPLRLNYGLIDQIKKSAIREILFTSGFGRNNAFRLFFVDVLKQKLTKDIRRDKECVLNPEIFGRPVRLRVLYSPVGTANISLSKSDIYLSNRHQYAGSKRPVQDFKVDYYKCIFNSG